MAGLCVGGSGHFSLALSCTVSIFNFEFALPRLLAENAELGVAYTPGSGPTLAVPWQ